MVRVDANLRVRRDRWIGRQFGQISRRPIARCARIDATVTAPTSGESQCRAALRQFVNCFSQHPLAAPVQTAAGPHCLLERK